jgi:hypothetical protein
MQSMLVREYESGVHRRLTHVLPQTSHRFGEGFGAGVRGLLIQWLG